MEYIREMLLRQRTALARLMLGSGTEETPRMPETQREASFPALAAWEWDGIAADGRESARTASAGWGVRRSEQRGAAAAGAREDSAVEGTRGDPTAKRTRSDFAAWKTRGDSLPAGETLRQALSRKSAARRRAAGSGLAGAGETALPPPASYRRAAGGAGGSTGGTGSVWSGGDKGAAAAGVLWEVRRPGEADSGASAKVLSRTFQRDARRYDGGFQLYD